MFRLACIISALSLGSCSTLNTSSKSINNENVGWLHGNCFAIKNDSILTAKSLTLYEFDTKNILTTASIIGKSKSGSECYALLEDRKKVNIENGYSFYKVEHSSPINIALGFLDLELSDTYKFDYCTTSEGISFSVYDSDAIIWEGYYYLGYESEATCK